MVKERKKDNYIRKYFEDHRGHGRPHIQIAENRRHGDYRVEYLSPGEARSLLSAAYDLRDRAMLALHALDGDT